MSTFLWEAFADKKTSHHVEMLVAEFSNMEVDSSVVWLQTDALLQDKKCSYVLQHTTSTDLITLPLVYTQSDRQ